MATLQDNILSLTSSRRNYQKEYYERNKERIKERSRKYWKDHRDEGIKKRKEYYNKNKDKCLKSVKEYKENNRDKVIQYQRNKNHEERKELLNLLGSKCVKCGYNDWRALQIDHINGGGRKEILNFGSKYRKIIKQKIIEGSKDYQILCANCNRIKVFENGECVRSLNTSTVLINNEV